MATKIAEAGRQAALKATSKYVEDATQARGTRVSHAIATKDRKNNSTAELVQFAAASIGFFSEIVHHNQEKKKLKEAIKTTELPKYECNPTSPPINANEAILAQDDGDKSTVSQGNKAEQEANSKKNSKDHAREFLRRRKADMTQRTELTLPVILPQRRPKDRSRGFVRAYSPMLSQAGINEDTFLDFIDTFNATLVPNPYLQAINLAGFVDYGVPEPVTLMIGFGLEYATDAVMEAQSRYKSNKFLGIVNAEFFKPMGLECMVVVWSPDNDASMANLKVSAGKPLEPSMLSNVQQIITQKQLRDKAFQDFEEGMNESLRSHSGAVAWNVSAPLVRPTNTVKENNEKKQNAFGRAEIWLDDYLDDTSQARRKLKHPDDPMGTMLPAHRFRSRYADPNHPAASGDLVALFTGGRWQYNRSQSTSCQENEKNETREHIDGRPNSERVETPRSSKSDYDSANRPLIEAKDCEEKPFSTERKPHSEDKDTGKIIHQSLDPKKSLNEEEKERKREKKQEKKLLKEKEKQTKKLEKKRKEKEKKNKKAEGEFAIGQGPKEDSKSGDEKPAKSTGSAGAKGLKSLLQKDVLYLVILNSASDLQPTPAHQSA